MEEEIRNAILKRVDEYGYKSAKFRLALVKDESFWKILVVHIILDISEPKKNKVFLKEESFVLEDIHVPISDFKKFIDYLSRVYIGDISPEGKATISKELQFTIGKYDLCFVGNFPGQTLDFFGRKIGKDHHGIDKPIYTVWYAIHQSVGVKKYPKLDLTGAEIPLRDVTEALNHFWGTNYEPHNLSHSCNFYMPIFEASISSFRIDDYENEPLSHSPCSILLEFDMDPKRTKIEDLSCGIIAEKRSNSFRDQSKSDSFRHQFGIEDNLLSVDLEFVPDSVSVYLNHKGKRIDEYNYYNYQASDYEPYIPRQSAPETLGLVEKKEQQDSLLDSELVSKMPKHIQSLLIEAEKSYQAGLYRATGMLFRSVLDEGITLIFKKLGMGEKMYNDKNFEMRLGQKIEMITDYVQSFGQLKKELESIKWFGDKATHVPKMPIMKKDITNNLEPNLRLILTKMVEELS